MVRVDRRKEASAAVARRALENARTEVQVEGADERRLRVKPRADGGTPEQARPPRGGVDARFRPFGQPRDWVDAAVRVITGAKVAPRSKGEKASGGVKVAARGRARPGMLRRRIGLLGFEAPEWLSDALLKTLVRMESSKSGSRGLLAKGGLEALLRDPPKLRRHLRAVAGGNAPNVSRKRPAKKRKQA